MAVSTDYSDRKVDFSIFEGAAADGLKPISITIGTSGKVITGAQKISQAFVRGLLTELGSVPGRSDDGVSFYALAVNGQFQDLADARSAFAIAASSLVLKLGPADGIPDDEALDSAELESVSSDKQSGTLSMIIALTFVGGPTRTVYLPLTIAIR